MQKNPMNKNRKENSMSSRTTPMNINQRANEKMRKTYETICDKRIQKRTSLQRNSVQVRDRPNGMATIMYFTWARSITLTIITKKETHNLCILHWQDQFHRTGNNNPNYIAFELMLSR